MALAPRWVTIRDSSGKRYMSWRGWRRRDACAGDRNKALWVDSEWTHTHILIANEYIILIHTFSSTVDTYYTRTFIVVNSGARLLWWDAARQKWAGDVFTHILNMLVLTWVGCFTSAWNIIAVPDSLRRTKMRDARASHAEPVGQLLQCCHQCERML